MPHVLIVEDDKPFAETLTLMLCGEGFAVTGAMSGTSALEQFDRRAIDIVLLEVAIPEVSGVEICRRLRQHSSVPIIMVTDRDDEIDKVVGLEVGADDYVTKPFSARELIARMRAALRRRNEPAMLTDRPLAVGCIRMDVDAYVVTVNDARVHLPLKEFELLEVLLRNAGRVLTRPQLISLVWGTNYVGDTKALDVHIKRIRSKVEPDPSVPRYIITVRGLGYKLEYQDQVSA
ncbi:two-component system, OmpR family, response regulator RegX3 [Micromonospora echinaurantiaca]|uniref:Sensory transduction protein RegX3 n=1 Tax=Micromonospora echinaurantiaca TaxID=47857 RepID=A0A1C5II22_9ACTN|nr:response regulator transcription factor [Micromonospora echinaurantiaca]SCG57659.1 two-component system, OmpR family, response regulator RegX3 [Micromonospora echinaurantiaca]